MTQNTDSTRHAHSTVPAHKGGADPHPGHGHVREHAHRQGHDHQHAHTPDHFGRAFALGVTLNLAFVAAEAWWGHQSGSLALWADAGHNLSDVAGLMLAWAAHAAGRLPPSHRRSFGWRKASILAGLLNALVLVGAILGLAYEALERFHAPAPVQSLTVIWVALAGVLVNGMTAALFASGRRHDLNLQGAFLHMAADALVSLGVVLAGLLTLWQGWIWLDPVVTLLILGVILAGTWSLLRQSLHLMLDGVPEGIDLLAIERYLRGLPGVQQVHGLHVWGLSTRENALMAHLVCPLPDPAFLPQATQGLAQTFGLHHVTLQIEALEQARHCPQAVQTLF